jgi:ABC-2 type transport system permease protein
MAADTLPVLRGVVRTQARPLVLWSLAVAAVSTIYISFYPSVGGAEMQSLIDSMPEDLVTALGYDRIGTAAGYLTSTVYGLLGPVLLLVFAIGTGARLIAGHEEDGTLELELTAPVSRRRLFAERLLALLLDLCVLVAVLTLTSWALVVALDIDVSLGNLLAGSTGLLLLTAGFGTFALAVGAVTGRRAVALGVAAGAAVAAYVLDAIGPTIDAGWMTAVSPFAWYLEADPLVNGLDPRGFALLAAVPVLSAAVGLVAFVRRDLMV